jgi:hypothetical protein
MVSEKMMEIAECHKTLISRNQHFLSGSVMKD